LLRERTGRRKHRDERPREQLKAMPD